MIKLISLISESELKSTITRFVDYPTQTPLGHTFKVEVKFGESLYRCVSQRDWYRIEDNGYLDTDCRNCVQNTEGTNLAETIESALTYCPNDDWSYLLEIDPTGLNLHGYEWDHYIRTWDKIPYNQLKVLKKIPPKS